jgi:hypothetical protein
MSDMIMIINQIGLLLDNDDTNSDDFLCCFDIGSDFMITQKTTDKYNSILIVGTYSRCVPRNCVSKTID